jgi:L-iditol 2-dehydrogenase
MLQLALRSAAGKVYLSEPLKERRELALRLGATAVCDPRVEHPVEWVARETGDRGVDVALEAAWGAEAVGQAVMMARHAGKVVLVGIPREDQVCFQASAARRKGLTILMSRRMKLVYRRAITLVELGAVDLKSVVTHRFALEDTAAAFDLVASFGDGVVKAVVEL